MPQLVQQSAERHSRLDEGHEEDVVVDDRGTATTVDDKTDDDPYGTSVYVRLSQGITDGLKLKAAVGYFFADDGYAPNGDDDDAYRMGLGLFWSW